MVTREENLKKINDKLELLSDEQLDEIAGGVFRFESAVASRLELAGGNVALESNQNVRLAEQNQNLKF